MVPVIWNSLGCHGGIVIFITEQEFSSGNFSVTDDFSIDFLIRINPYLQEH